MPKQIDTICKHEKNRIMRKTSMPLLLVMASMVVSPSVLYADDTDAKIAADILRIIGKVLDPNNNNNNNNNNNGGGGGIVTPGYVPKFGVRTVPGLNGAKITYLVPNSIAARLNLKVGYELINLNGIATRRLNDIQVAMNDAYQEARADSDGVSQVLVTYYDNFGDEHEDYFHVTRSGSTALNSNVIKSGALGTQKNGQQQKDSRNQNPGPRGRIR